MIDKDEYTQVDYFTIESGPQLIPESNKINKKVQKLHLKVLTALKKGLHMKIAKSCMP
jgi:hypothetical protein